MNPDELKQQLAELEKNLKAATTAEAKAELEKQKTELEKKLADATKDIPELRKELDAAKAEIKTSNETIRVMKDAADKNQAALDKIIAGGNHLQTKKENKSFNDVLVETLNDPENMEKLKAVVSEKTKSTGKMNFKAVGDMSFGANFSTAVTSVTDLRPGIITLPRRKLHVRELIPGGSMSTSNYAFLREKTTGEGNPATVAEGNWKEQFDIDLEEISYPAEYIAGYLVASRKMMDDIPAFISFLQMRLLEKLLRVEDQQLLTGSGVTPNLSGLTLAANSLTPTSAATIDELQLIDAISQLEMADRDANGILVTPQSYYLLYQYSSAGSGDFTNTRLSTIVNGQLYIAGVPVFRSTAMPSDKFLVGDWANGSAIITREAPRVEIFYEDGNNVRRNQVTVRVEERIAFPTFGNNYYVYGDFGHS